MALSREVKEMRKLFRERYGNTTENVLKRLAKGKSCKEIAEKLNLNVKSIATTKGNYTRDCYYPFAYPNEGIMTGSCEY